MLACILVENDREDVPKLQKYQDKKYSEEWTQFMELQ